MTRGNEKLPPRMTGGQLIELMDEIGVSDVWVADVLGVRRDTVRNWRTERDPIPYRVPGSLAEAAEELSQRAGQAAKRITETFPPMPDSWLGEM